jgi:hypothetical protein
MKNRVLRTKAAAKENIDASFAKPISNRAGRICDVESR